MTAHYTAVKPRTTQLGHSVRRKKRRVAKEGGVSKAPAFTPPVSRRAFPDYREEE